MKQIKVSEATGPALDWLVAKCEGLNVTIPAFAEHPWVQVHHPDGAKSLCPAFSTDWSHGGPIIEMEGISIIKLEHLYGVDSRGYTTRKRIPVFGAVIGEYFDTDQQRNSYGESWGDIYYMNTELVIVGPTPLIAAMRCYCQSKLGDTVEVPEEL